MRWAPIALAACSLSFAPAGCDKRGRAPSPEAAPADSKPVAYVPMSPSLFGPAKPPLRPRPSDARWAGCVARRAMSLAPAIEVRLIAELLASAKDRARAEPIVTGLRGALAKLPSPGARARATTALARAALALDDATLARALVDEAAPPATLGLKNEASLDLVDAELALDDAAEIYARLGAHDRVEAVLALAPARRARAASGSVSAGLGYALAGEAARARARIPATPAGLREAIPTARALALLGDEAAVGRAIAPLAPAEQALARLRIAEDAIATGAKERARSSLAAATELAPRAAKDHERATTLIGVGEAWTELREPALADAALTRAAQELAGSSSIYADGVRHALVEARAAAGQLDAAEALLATLEADAGLANLGPAPLARMEVLLRRGRALDAARVFASSTLASDGLALALLFVRGARPGVDPAFDDEMARSIDAYCPER